MMVLAIICVVFVMMISHVVEIWVTLLDDCLDDYEYCIKCPYGFCLENPKTDECLKWKDEEPLG